MKKVHLRIKRESRAPSHPIFLIGFILVCLAVFLFLVLSRRVTAPPAPKKAEIKSSLPSESSPFSPVLETKEIVVKPGQTISDILALFDFSPSEIYQLRQQVKPVYDLARIIAGRKIKFFLDETNQLHSFEYQVDEQQFLQVRRVNNGFQAELLPLPYEIKTRMIFGTITDNLIDSINNQGESDFLALALAEIFAWTSGEEILIKLSLRKNIWKAASSITAPFWRRNSPIRVGLIKPSAILILIPARPTISPSKANHCAKNF